MSNGPIPKPSNLRTVDPVTAANVLRAARGVERACIDMKPLRLGGLSGKAVETRGTRP